MLRGRNASRQTQKGKEILINVQIIVEKVAVPITSTFIGKHVQAMSKKQQLP